MEVLQKHLFQVSVSRHLQTRSVEVSCTLVCCEEAKDCLPCHKLPLFPNPCLPLANTSFSTLLILFSYSTLCMLFFFFFSLLFLSFSTSSSCGSSYFMLPSVLPTPAVPCAHRALKRNVRKFLDRFSLQHERHLLSMNAFLPTP